MFTTSRSKTTGLLALIAVVVLSTFGLLTSSTVRGSDEAAKAAPPSTFTATEAIIQITADDGVLRFDVAEDGNRFLWSSDPEMAGDMPAAGTPYITQGYIYPEGTLTESNGVLADGSPEFPDKVLGQWTCYGWWIGDAAHVEQSAPWVSSHLFNFGGTLGEATIVTEGYSIDDLDAPLERAIVGGSGQYTDARGVQLETNLGYNASKGMNFRYEVRVAEA
jgi:hypothetical protein